jgi:hypothetical protein
MLNCGRNNSCILHMFAMVVLSHSVHTCALFSSNLHMCIHIPDTFMSIPCLSHIEIPFPLFNSKDILYRGMLLKFCNFDHTGQLQFALA